MGEDDFMKVIQKYDQLVVLEGQHRNFYRMLNSNIPDKKYKKLQPLLAGYIQRKYNAEQEFKNRYRKLSKAQKELFGAITYGR